MKGFAGCNEVLNQRTNEQTNDPRLAALAATPYRIPVMGISIRDVTPADAEALAHILVTTNETTFRGIVAEQCLQFTEAESAANWRRMLTAGLPSSDCFLVASEVVASEVVASEEDPVPIGYVWGTLCSDQPTPTGELKQIMLLPWRQRRGLGRLLVRRIARHLESHGVQRMRVEVLRINPHRGFYERLGAKYISERPYDWDGVTMSMCLYEWPDVRELTRETTIETSR
jgi:ribosomal protein S18 acetylase RimI-like enzyme